MEFVHVKTDYTDVPEIDILTDLLDRAGIMKVDDIQAEVNGGPGFVYIYQIKDTLNGKTIEFAVSCYENGDITR